MHIIIRAGSRDRRNIPGVVCYFLRTFAPLVFENRIFENRNAKLWQGCSLQKMPRNDEVFFPRVFSFSYTSRGAFFFFGGDLSPTLTTTEARKKKTEKATLFVGIAMKRKSHLFVAIAMKNNPCQIRLTSLARNLAGLFFTNTNKRRGVGVVFCYFVGWI